MPCNTAHAFLGGIREQFTVPFVDLIEVTVAEAGRLSGGTAAWGLLATTGCVEAGVYQSAPGVGGRALQMPDKRSQSELMDTIFAIKAGRKGDRERAALRAQADALIANGAELIIAGCTEIPLVLRAADLDVPFVSSTEVLARRTVALASGRRDETS
ncbi:MAG: aspartate/glutamate racemase family protein, partial [Woeseiaceae bacterium]